MDIRARWFRHNPLCVVCLALGVYTEATDLDHVIPLHLGGKDDDSNRQSLCGPHHKEKTLLEKKAREAHRRGGGST